jgi:hypothetical protein
LGAVIALGMAAIVCAGCSEDTAAPKTAQAPVAATPAPPAKPADTKEALAEHNRMMQRQREYWLKHGQGH